ncbi:CRISPR associated protein Cas2 [Desulfovibrio sp. X2]|uniref:CRISPR-associated endonuclease Cas2 n=1 Tax=Desulfovibrio sp. X2 TaxID=941449 RepID=UPI000358F099|nr:CRISPR-associated endonuclease Cas2 [Desulfovibrio sp. X2]EPR43461.1 CRISPR associated protein Cas2 [Desulfovibrio sp. X2]
MLVLVSYDVSTIDPKGPGRLRRMAKICQNWGQRVQNSVFECLVDPAQWTALRAKLLDCMDPEHDSLRFYFLGANWQRRVEHAGARKPIDQEGNLIV